jgi:hypothetical protein
MWEIANLCPVPVLLIHIPEAVDSLLRSRQKGIEYLATFCKRVPLYRKATVVAICLKHIKFKIKFYGASKRFLYYKSFLLILLYPTMPLLGHLNLARQFL